VGGVAALAAVTAVDHAAASAIPAFPDWEMNCRRVKDTKLIESNLNL